MSKILLLGQPRTGTSYITQLFKSYHEKKGRDIGTYSKKYYNVFKEHLRLLAEMKDIEKTQYHLDFLKNNDVDIFSKDHLTHYGMHYSVNFDPNDCYRDFYKIKIIRKDIIETSLSLLIAKNSKMYNTFKVAHGNSIIPHSLPNKFIATREETEHNLKTIQQYSDMILNYTDMDFDQTIYYEDLSGDPTKDQMLFPMLAKSPVENLTVKIVKRGNYSDSIENYEQVLEWINHK